MSGVPAGLGARGRRLWKALLAQDATLADVEAPAREIAVSACRTADRVDRLEVLAQDADPLVPGKFGEMVNPLFGEVRQQEATLARLLAALRLPDEKTGRRPIKRPPRGVQRPSGRSGGAQVSSLELAREARGYES